MTRMRFSVAGMLGLVALTGLGFASLRQATVWWTTVASTITLAVLLTGLLGAIYLPDGERAFCLGFSLFAWTYLILVNWDWVGGQFGHDLTRGLGDLAENLIATPPPPTPLNPPVGGYDPVARANSVSATFNAADQSVRIGNLVQISRMFVSLLFGLMGGFVARGFASRTLAAVPSAPAGLHPRQGPGDGTTE